MENKFCLLSAEELDALVYTAIARFWETIPNHSNSVEKTPMIPDVYTMDAAAKMLKICRATLYSLIRSGDIKSIPVGRKRMISSFELNNFLTTKKLKK